MGVLPISRLGKLEFYESHMALWSANAVAIGLNALQVSALQALVTAARAQYSAQQIARDAAKAATLSFHTKINSMQDAGSDAIKAIKSYAASKNDPNVYVLANIPAPAAPTPAGPPVPPTDLFAAMTPDGAIRLTWKGSLAQRQFFSIWRQLPSQTLPVQIGSVAAKEFSDNTVPRALPQVVYNIRAQRDSAISVPTPNLTVYFGAIPGAGGMLGAMVDGQVIGVIDPSMMKKAA